MRVWTKVSRGMVNMLVVFDDPGRYKIRRDVNKLGDDLE